MPPLIVTALLDEVAQERFDRLRREHFPPERNHLAAHLTLFHHLPDDPAVGEALAAAADRPTITARVRRVRGWRGGVAYDLAAPELTALRGRLAQCWSDLLSAQDRSTSTCTSRCRTTPTPRPPSACTLSWPRGSRHMTWRSSAWACGATWAG